ncbi:hypothetical protein XH96_36810 [Bradyrhizobium sp. CCBAU 51765]|nr:hypothetical protein XH96_36810 [Bradyrhizobium sp. CCBAU 51765]
MPGLVPGIHVLSAAQPSVEGRDKPGHDAVAAVSSIPPPLIRGRGAITPGDYRPVWLTFR